MPIIGLRGGQLSVSFDDLTHEYHRYAYRLTHCEADWKPSEALSESDYCDGFASGNTIDDVQESILTNTLYTHYRLTLPNGQCAMKLSQLPADHLRRERRRPRGGTHCLHGDGAGRGTDGRGAKGADQYGRNHQPAPPAGGDGGGLAEASRVTDPQRQITTSRLQNQRWDDARWNARPQYTMAD